ncbi:MAG: cobalamin-binding protein [Betaproteobacteria bacterium]|nr:cobalamin-binding protein [Betaproteobacteria bacterium]
MDLRDAAGTLHSPAPSHARIVSLVPSITELVCDLGLADRLVGRTGFCIHPQQALGIPKVGGTKTVDIDKIRALRPTHVILNIDENEKPLAEALAGFVAHLIVTHPLAPLDNLALYRLIGGIFGAGHAAEQLCTRFQHAHDALVAQRHLHRSVLYLIWKDPWMTVSRDTYVSRTLALAGLHTLPVTATARYPELSLQADWVAQADMVLLSTEPYMFREKHLTDLAGRPAFAGKPVRLIDGEMTSWYGSRAIQGLSYLGEFRRGMQLCGAPREGHRR